MTKRNKMTRKEAREAAFELLFESTFRKDEKPFDIYEISAENREIKDDAYVRGVFFGVIEKEKELDELIGSCSEGWKPERISRVSRTIMRIAAFEMLNMKDIPYTVSINEALELCKKYDDEKARPFVNGVLNAVKNTLPEKKND